MLPALRHAQGVIVHSRFAKRVARAFASRFAEDWAVIPLMRRRRPGGGYREARAALGIAPDDFLVCAFGATGRIKRNLELLQAWMASSLASDPRARLVFVGDEEGGEYGRRLQHLIAESGLRQRVRITGFASAGLYRQYLRAADAAVQLRTLSRGESSAAVLDCMAHGVPTVVNAHGAMAELPEDCVVRLPDAFSGAGLAAALEALRADPVGRRELGLRARRHVEDRRSPRPIADQYHAAIEHLHAASHEALMRRTVSALAAIEAEPTGEGEWLSLARAMNANTPVPQPHRQLLVDVTEMARDDCRTGIQRVARSILKGLLNDPLADFRVEPVYTVPGQAGYLYARNFTLRFLGCPEHALQDEPVEIRAGDLFFGLDLNQRGVVAQSDYLADIRRRGVSLKFIVYDLIPLHFPECFPADGGGATGTHARWLSVLKMHADHLIAISRAVAADVEDWLRAGSGAGERGPRVDWFHLGSDIESSRPVGGLPDGAEEVLAAIAARPAFLSVATLEPRKGHAQALAAFGELWQAGCDVSLVFVGRQGWLVEALVDEVRGHPQWGKRMFWLDGISDEYLQRVYRASACLLAASKAEGFGLPLVEAARHGLPILARDIPVFREVAGEFASYFSGDAPQALGLAIRDWLALFADGRHRKPEGMPLLTWADSIAQLRPLLLEDRRAAAGVGPCVRRAQQDGVTIGA